MEVNITCDNVLVHLTSLSHTLYLGCYSKGESVLSHYLSPLYPHQILHDVNKIIN
jgi:hypothetical protein